MKLIGLLATTLIMASSSVAIAQDQAPATEKEDAAKPEKKVCKSEKMTGSLTRVKRTCLTAAQWDELAERTRKGVNDLTGLASRSDRQSLNTGAAQGWQ